MNQLALSSVLIAGLLKGCSQNNAPTLPQFSMNGQEKWQSNQGSLRSLMAYQDGNANDHS